MAGLDARYSRQVLLAELGEEGQRKLLDSTILVVGCGALGSNLASLTVRAGIGTVRLADRDLLEPTNLHRQVLFDEDDVAAHRHAPAEAVELPAVGGGELLLLSEMREALMKELRKSRDPRVVGPDTEVFDTYIRYSPMREFPKPK